MIESTRIGGPAPLVVILAVVALLAAVGAPASGSADTYPKNFAIDVQHYRFELRLSDETDRIEGATTIEIRFVDTGVTGFSIDLVGRENAASDTGVEVEAVEELRLQGDRIQTGILLTPSRTTVAEARAHVDFAHGGDRLLIRLDRPSEAGEVRKFLIRYAGKPATGLQIGDNKHGDRTFFSDNWPNRARHWLPTMDHPYDKATSEMIVTAPNHYQVISNGLLIEETDLDETDNGVALRRTHWRQSVPIATWLYVLGAAPFAVDYFDDIDGLSLQTWVYTQDRDAGFYDFSDPTRDAMEFYADLIGPYAYEKLANIQSNSVGGGMEAASAIFYGDNSVTGERSVRWRNVIIHEIAHQWWGNAVTESDWDDVWLSEGFATYFTLVYRDYAYGREDFLAGLADAKRRIVEFYADNPDYRIVHDNLDDMSRVTTGMQYQKGAWFLHMLRGVMGEDRFWAGIREYYRRYFNGNASTDDFREVMEGAYGPQTDLSHFFREWLYQGGLPRLEGTWSWDASESKVVVRLDRIDGSPNEFYMPIPVAVHLPGGGGRRGGPRVEMHSVRIPQPDRSRPQGPLPSDWVHPSTVTFIDADREPTDVVLDPDSWVLMEADFRRAERD